MSKEKKIFNFNVNSKTVFLSLLIVIGYLVWDKFNTQAQVNAKKKREFTAYMDCVSIAENNYNDSWMKACGNYAENSKRKLSACKKSVEVNANYLAFNEIQGLIDNLTAKTAHMNARSISFKNYKNLLNIGLAACERNYGNSSYQSNCFLPHTTAKSLNAELKEEREICKDISKKYA